MKLSIITVVYNNKFTIKDAISSVFEQTYEEIEYIIIDGGSKDGTKEILYEEHQKYTILVSESDNGIYDAMNKGIRLASGEIIGILNSDDIYASNFILSNISNILIYNDVDALYGDVTYFNGFDPENYSRYFSSACFTPSRLKWGLMPAHTSLFFKSSVFEKYGYYKIDYKIAADFEFICRVFKNKNFKYLYFNKVLIRMKFGGLSTKNILSKFIIQKEILRACNENKIITNHAILMLRFLFK